MHDEATNPTAVDATPNRPLIVHRATWQAELDELRTRAKAHTRAGDAIAAARRKLPMVEVERMSRAVWNFGGGPGLVTTLRRR
jgi:predicted dithiol-disulfide oxidoreductase (DUF899 family)